jgi:transcriptional regulator with XRE-family HTH domain
LADEQHGSFGAQLRQRRQAAGLTQEDLAARAGLTAKGIAAPVSPRASARAAMVWG